MLTPTRCTTCRRDNCALIPTGNGTYICLACLDATTPASQPAPISSKPCT